LGDRRAEAGDAAVKILRACLATLLGVMLATTAGSQTMLDTLFDKLKTATDPFAVQALEQGIWEQWTMVPDAGHRQLMFQGIAEMQQQELESARTTFTRLIEVAPELPEAWNKRATVHWLLGNFPASIADICETVKREPRHFGAYSGLGMIRAQMGEHARAAAAFELAKKWNPHIAGLDAEIERQKAEAVGETSDDPLGCGQQTAGR
jgi:tetratricopeptide (TPR) repeat protein